MSNGNYQYTYTPPVGFGGTITIWAANPLVVDLLNQAQVNVYRLYDNPSFGDITMSQNDSLNFSHSTHQPQSFPLTGFTTTCSAYQVSGNTRTPISTLTGTNTGAGFVLGHNQSASVNLQLTAAMNAPSSAQVVFTFTSAERGFHHIHRNRDAVAGGAAHHCADACGWLSPGQRQPRQPVQRPD